MNKKISIELNDKQEAKYQEWLAAIKVLYGKYGKIVWSVSSTGIGNEISAYSVLAKSTIDLTDVDSW